jgi:hypothetical protein
MNFMVWPVIIHVKAELADLFRRVSMFKTCPSYILLNDDKNTVGETPRFTLCCEAKLEL